MAIRISTSVIIVLLLSFEHVRTDDWDEENVVRTYQLDSYKIINFEKATPTSADFYFTGIFYLKPIKNRRYTFSGGIYNYSCSISGDYARVPDLAKCKNFRGIDRALKEPIVIVYDENGVLQHIEVNENIDYDFSEVMKLYLFSCIQIDALKIQEKGRWGNTTIKTEEFFLGNERQVISNVNLEDSQNATKYYWIRKDYNTLARRPEEQLEMDREDTKNICAIGETRNYYGFEDVVLQFKSDPNEESIESRQENAVRNYKPLKNYPMRLLSKLQVRFERIYPEISWPDTEIESPLILKKFSIERPNSAMIEKADTSSKLDNIPWEYLSLCCDYTDLIAFTTLQYGMNCGMS